MGARREFSTDLLSHCRLELVGASLGVCLLVALFNLTPTYQAEVHIHFATNGDLVSDFGANKLG